MTPDQVRAQLSVEDLCNGETPEETIELCNAVISEAERIKEIAEAELEEEEDYDDDEE